MSAQNDWVPTQGRHLFPGLIFPLSGMAGEIEPRELCESVRLRNPFDYEVDSINDLIGQFRWGFGVKKILPRNIFAEVSLPEHTEWRDGSEMRVAGELFSEKILTLLRLFQPGPLSVQIMIVPLAEKECSYHLDQLKYLLALKRAGGYPDHYDEYLCGIEAFSNVIGTRI